MSVQKVVAILGLCAMLVLCFGIFANVAHAQDDAKNAAKKVDKDLAKRQGVSGALAKGNKEEKPERATPAQMAIGIGSIFVMIAVLKWL